MANVFKKVPEDLLDKSEGLNKEYEEAVHNKEYLEKELVNSLVSIAKLEVEDIIEDSANAFYIDVFENLSSEEVAPTLKEAYFKVVKSISKELTFLVELQELLENNYKEDVPSDLKELKPYANVLSYVYD